MPSYLIAAAATAVIVGIVHSVLGELLVFRKVRTAGVVPKEATPPLQARNVRILWATWHLASAFGFGFAGVLWSLAQGSTAPDPFLIGSLVAAFAVGSALVAVATRGKHPGWIGLLAVAVLTALGGSG